jgi:hypothetical protein
MHCSSLFPQAIFFTYFRLALEGKRANQQEIDHECYAHGDNFVQQQVHVMQPLNQKEHNCPVAEQPAQAGEVVSEACLEKSHVAALKNEEVAQSEIGQGAQSETKKNGR